MSSGRFLLRIPAELHERLRSQAAIEGLSLNEYCMRRLAVSGPAADGADVMRLVEHASEMFGDRLVGILSYGSLARGEASRDSDADVLIVVDRSQPVTRDLYRVWDARPHTIGGRAVDAHFTYLPERRPVGGIWAESAVDGRVLFERDQRIREALAQIRRDIADGMLRRHSVHGQSYWTAA